MARTHVVGAGIAGLSSAVSLAREGHGVTLYESGAHAGGRCRSFYDGKIERVIDNGNHLLLSGNTAAMRFLADIGATDRLAGPNAASFPFVDVHTGQRWCVRPNAGRAPWWILSPKRRVPGTHVRDYASALRIATAGRDHTVKDRVGDAGVLFKRFWEPLAVGALNTPAADGAARLLWPVLRDTFARGAAFCQPRVARKGLSDTLVDPALNFLRERGADIRFKHRLRAITTQDCRARHLDFGVSTVTLGDGDSVVLALPPWMISSLLPSVSVPEKHHAIVNAHFRLPAPALEPMLGIIGGTAQWLFVRGDVASVTVSAADALAEKPADLIARAIWTDINAALGLSLDTAPPYHIIKEKRATFAQTPEEVRRRPPTRCMVRNVFLAGDWIDTGLPATIESAARSGHMATRAITGRRYP